MGDEEGRIRLFSNMREREHYDNLADLFAIIRSTEALEKAFLRDTISNEEYKTTCAKLLNQFSASRNICGMQSDDSVRKFMTEMRMNCPAATTRLLVEGIPLASETTDDSSKVIAETVQFFITAMDSLKLEMRAVDQLYPLLSDLYESLCRISKLPVDWEGKVSVRKWLTDMKQRRADEELDTAACRQILFDLENAYAAFHKSLST